MMPMGHVVTPLRERFEAKFVPVTESGCWLWTGALAKTGYGHIFAGERNHPEHAHRVAWKIYRGPIPAGRLVLHKCDVRCCVNPDHLYIGGKSENAIDWYRRGRRGRNERI